MVAFYGDPAWHAGFAKPAKPGYVLKFTKSSASETVLTVKVSSADHETEEGYFSLGDNATVIVKPGSELYRFLSRQRGHKVKIVLQEAGGPDLSRIER